jgi:hypothetical protein
MTASYATAAEREAGITYVKEKLQAPRQDENLMRLHNRSAAPGATSDLAAQIGSDTNRDIALQWMGERLFRALTNYARTAQAANSVSPDVFKMSLPTKATPGGTPAGAWEIANTGGKNYLLEGGGSQFWADGVMGTTIQEAKFIGNAARSPFVPGSGVPDFIRTKVVGQVDDEFARMARIIADPSNPMRNVEVIVSDPSANRFFIDMLKKHGLDGRVINR